MENVVTHSSKRASATAAGGYRSKAMYDDVFGGPPRLHSGGQGLSPRVEDYREIFGGFHAPSSSRASIPVLNIPSSSYDDLDARAPSTPFEYADVFGGFGDADFAVSYDELVRMMDNGRGGFSSGEEDDDDEDDAWTMSEGEYLSEGSNVKNRRLSDGDSCESANGSTEFSISYHKAVQSSADLLNGITHVAQLPYGPEYSCVVDRSSSFSNTDDDYLPYKVNNGHLNADFSGEMVKGRLLRKTMSQPANGDGIGSVVGDDIRSYKGYVRNGSFPNEPFVTITDVSLRTQPSDLPPPRRPPPALDVQKVNLDGLQAEHGGFDYEGDDGDGSLPYFDVVVDAGSSAAVSAAAIKEAMEKAEAKLKSAKERMEKKKGVEQTHTKTISMKNSKDMEERVTQLLDGSSTRRDERLQSSPRGQDIVVELPVSQGKQKSRQAPHTLPDAVDRKNYPTLTRKYSEEKHERESLSSEGSVEIDGDDEWKEANQYYELVKPEKLTRPFSQASSANVVGKTVNDFKLEKKGKSGMDGLQQVDLIMGLTRTKSKLEGNHAKPETGKLHQGLEKVLSVGEDIKWEENGEELTVERRSVENDPHDVNENTEMLELNGWFQPMKSQSEIKKTVKQKGEGLEPTKLVRAKSKQNENEIKLAYEQAENERRVAEAFEQDEKEKKIRKKYEQEKTDKKQKPASRREQNENRLKEALQLEGSKRRQKEVLEKEAHDRTMKENTEKEENGRKQKIAIEKEETEKRERAAREREENEKRLKETIEKEKERRQQEMIQREEIEIKQREAREKQNLEKRLEREKKEQIIQENAAREENEKKQREYQEREEKEKRMRETFEREENERMLNDNQREEPVKRWQETRGSEEEKLEKEECGRPLKAATDGIVDLEENETCNHEENANKMHESEVTDESEKVMLNGQSQVELNHNALPSESGFDGTNNLRDSRLPVKQKSRIGEVETRLANDRNVGIQAEPRDAQRRPLPSEDYPAENYKKTGEFRDATEQLKFDRSRTASSSDANVGNLATKAGNGRNEEGENIERARVTSNQEGFKDNFMPARVMKDEETDKTLRKGALPHLAKVGVEESVQRTVPTAVPEQTAERKAKNLHATMSSVQRESERVKREKELEQERQRKLEEEREREREREKDRMAVDKSTLEARANAEFREKAERAAVERIMNEARERLEKACAEARGKSLADKAPVDARFRADRAAVERAGAEARERAYQKAMAERATFDMRDRVESSMPGNLSASSKIGVRPNSSNHTDGPYYMERSGVEGESPQRCKARLERHRRTAERAAKALAEKNMRDLVAQREQAERTRLAETLDADVKRWSSGKEGNLRALLSTLQYILGPDSGWQPVPLTEVITAAAVKKAYRKATLCVHPDKLQQRGASIQQKYICEKVFDLLKEAWNRFNSEEW